MLSAADKQAYKQNGYVVAKELFTEDEVAFYRDHYMQIRAAGTYPGDDAGIDIGSNDPLKQFPRLIHMHRWDQQSLLWMIDRRIRSALVALLEHEPYAVQTMVYFKPPGSRGQALHQDQYFLRVQPGICMAAWLALDACDESNGCMQVVPGSHTWPLLCATKADTTQSFSDVTVPLPKDTKICPVVMNAGDMLFFNGSLVHGSFPNTTTDRFRRSLIGHYIQGDAEKVGQWYHPVLRMDGTPLEFGVSPGGTRCGVWTEAQGQPIMEINGFQVVDPATHD